MPDQLSQQESGKICGKKLPCSHRCSERVGSNHVCVCNRKWTFDPGCGHKVTGPCLDYSTTGLPCLEPCEKVLDCGHPCLEPCNSDACFCHLCFDKHSVVTLDSDNSDKSKAEKSSATTEIVAYPTLKLVSPKVSSTRKNRNARFASSLAFPAKKEQEPQKAATNGNGFHGLQNGFDNNEPCSSKMAYGNTNCSAIPPPKQPQPGKIHISFKDASGAPLQKIPEHKRSKLNKMLSQAIQSNGDLNAFEIKICVKGHWFHPDYHHCDICGCGARRPEVTVIHLPPGHGIRNGLDMDLNDDNAWKLGYAKCVNAHYFRAHLRRCDACGKKPEFQLPDGYYSDSDSD